MEIAFLTSPPYKAISEFEMRTLTSSEVPVNCEIAAVIIFFASFDLLFYCRAFAYSKNIEHRSLSENYNTDIVFVAFIVVPLFFTSGISYAYSIVASAPA